jgi:hypothetical protein
MKEITEKIGTNAGKIWNTINTYGPQNQSALIKSTRLTLRDFYEAVGWLAREDKIYKDGLFYNIGHTNLTNKIGEDAGKIWRVLETNGEVSMTSIPKISEIKVQDAYSALGWLAREDKIVEKKLKSNTVIVKLK